MWPDHYPDSCPPSAAVSPSETVYRFTNRCNPKSKDFKSYYELKPNENWGSMACNARGLSVYSSINDCIAAAEVIPALKKKGLAKADLPKNSGLIAETISQRTKNHKTFWSSLTSEELADLFYASKLETT